MCTPKHLCPLGRACGKPAIITDDREGKKLQQNQ